MAASPSQPCPGRSWVPRLPLWTPCPTGRRAVTLSAPSRSTGTLASGSGTRGGSTMNPDRGSQGSPEEEGGERGGNPRWELGGRGEPGSRAGCPSLRMGSAEAGRAPQGSGPGQVTAGARAPERLRSRDATGGAGGRALGPGPAEATEAWLLPARGGAKAPLRVLPQE